MNTKKDTTIKIRITSQEKNELKATATKQQKTMSNLLRDAIVKYNEKTIRLTRIFYADVFTGRCSNCPKIDN